MPSTAVTRSSGMSRIAPKSISPGENPNWTMLVGLLITIGSPRLSPPKDSLNFALIASRAFSSSAPLLSLSGAMTTPGTPRLCRIEAEKREASSSTPSSRKSVRSGERPLREFSGSRP